MKKYLPFFSMLAILGMLAWQTVEAQTACTNSDSGEGISPYVLEGNPNACAVGGTFGFKLNGAPDGTHYLTADYGALIDCSGGLQEPDAVNYVTISSDGIYFDWTASPGLVIEQVIVKGGPNANVYDYRGQELYSDTDLHSPVKQATYSDSESECFYGISHIEFVYSYKLDISKTTEALYTRTWTWDISKTVDPAQHDLFIGESGTSTYTVIVTKSDPVDSDWGVSGTITVVNNTPYDATITDISDVVGGLTTATLSCSFPYTLTSGSTLECTYTADLDGGSNTSNTVTVTTSGLVKGGSATADVIFGDPTTLVNDEVDVTDDYSDQLWENVNATTTFTYTGGFGCAGPVANYVNGFYEYLITNTAKIEQTGQSDHATVTVNCYAPVVSKTAEALFTRTYEWTIDKSVDVAEHHIFAGDEATSTYTVSVDKTSYTDSEFGAEGTITVFNPNLNASMEVTLSDEIAGGYTATFDCGGTLTVPGGTSRTCNYTITGLPDNTSRTNTATVTLNGYDFTATADVIFGDPTTEVNEEINVTDTNGGSWGPVSDDDSWTYTRTFDCDGMGEYTDGVASDTYDNTATITETGASDDATVTVYCYIPIVTKDANTSYNRYYTWTIDKAADQTDLTLSLGQVFTVNYYVTVSASYVDDDFAVEGTISVYNPHPTATMNVSLSDALSDGTPVTLDCAGSLTIGPLSTGTCGYSADLEDATSLLNTATVTLNELTYTGSAAVEFGEPDDLIDDCIDLTDAYAGDHIYLDFVCADDAPETFEYSRVLGGYVECGYYEVPNTASFVTDDTQAKGSDSWIIDIDVPCDGCTLTQGYWKTHSKYGPAPYDDNWENLCDVDIDGTKEYEDETFFLSGQTYYEVLWTPPAGNVYYILAPQYIAALLNVLNGADPSVVLVALVDAEALFAEYAPDDKNLKKKDVRREFIALAEWLDDYNNGITGPGHCTEEEFDTESSAKSLSLLEALDPVDLFEFEETVLEAYPNPFRDELNFHVVMPYESNVTLEVFNLAGQKVAILYDNNAFAGQVIDVKLNTSQLKQQTLIYRLSTSRELMSGKLIPLKK
ncbi:MAG: hypothetical protein RQ743_03540 [Bacteroidales bacterium]|nr:hypothetical protein [Bacteroidales bacterium]